MTAEPEECPRCKGRGVWHIPFVAGPGWTCGACEGKGVRKPADGGEAEPGPEAAAPPCVVPFPRKFSDPEDQDNARG